MKEELIKLLPALEKTIEAGASYSSELFTRAITFYTFKLSFFILIEILMFIISLAYIFKKTKEIKKEIEKDKSYDIMLDINPITLILLVVGFIFLFMSVVLFITDIINLIQLRILPEMFFIELLKQ